LRISVKTIQSQEKRKHDPKKVWNYKVTMKFH
jgi:hypothetical protein